MNGNRLWSFDEMVGPLSFAVGGSERHAGPSKVVQSWEALLGVTVQSAGDDGHKSIGKFRPVLFRADVLTGKNCSK